MVRKFKWLLAVSLVGGCLGADGCAKAREVGQLSREAATAAKAAVELERQGKTTVKTDEGELAFEVDKQGKRTTMTATGQDGTRAKWTVGGKPDTSRLGLALYPGAQPQGGGDVSSGPTSAIMVQLETPDAFEKVASFYTAKYPRAQRTQSSGSGAQTLVLLVSEAPDFRSVTVMRQRGSRTTQITLIRHQPQAGVVETK